MQGCKTAKCVDIYFILSELKLLGCTSSYFNSRNLNKLNRQCRRNKEIFDKRFLFIFNYCYKCYWDIVNLFTIFTMMFITNNRKENKSIF